MMGLTGIEPVRSGLQPDALPFELQPLVIPSVGFEPTITTFKVWCLTILAKREKY